MAFPGHKYHTHVAKFSRLEEVCLVWPFVRRTEYKEYHIRILPDSTSVFSSYNLVVYPHYITVINLSSKYNNMSIPMSFAQESLKVVVILGTPNLGKIWRDNDWQFSRMEERHASYPWMSRVLSVVNKSISTLKHSSLKPQDFIYLLKLQDFKVRK